MQTVQQSKNRQRAQSVCKIKLRSMPDFQEDRQSHCKKGKAVYKIDKNDVLGKKICNLVHRFISRKKSAFRGSRCYPFDYLVEFIDRKLTRMPAGRLHLDKNAGIRITRVNCRTAVTSSERLLVCFQG